MCVYQSHLFICFLLPMHRSANGLWLLLSENLRCTHLPHMQCFMYLGHGEDVLIDVVRENHTLRLYL